MLKLSDKETVKMSIKDDIQNALKEAMKSQDKERLECLRMAKGALLLVEKGKEKDSGITDEECVASLRSEVKKRQQSMESYRELKQDAQVSALEREIAVLEEFLPKQLGAAQLEEKIRAYLAEHPEINHAGKLTGAIKKELGDLADGKMLIELCTKVLGG